MNEPSAASGGPSSCESRAQLQPACKKREWVMDYIIIIICISGQQTSAPIFSRESLRFFTDSSF